MIGAGGGVDDVGYVDNLSRHVYQNLEVRASDFSKIVEVRASAFWEKNIDSVGISTSIDVTNKNY